jgi:uncharacterized membrane protein
MKLIRPFSEIKITRTTFYIFIAFLSLIAIWYSLSADSSSYGQIVSVINRIVDQTLSKMDNNILPQGIALITSDGQPFLHELTKYLHVIMQFLIVIGFVYCIVRSKEFRIRPTYSLASFSILIILVLCLTIPAFASALNTSRFYHISLILLSPYAIVGVIKTADVIGKMLLRAVRYFYTGWALKKHISLNFVTILIVAFLLFNSGLIYYFAGESGSSISLDAEMDYSRNTDSQYAGSKWIHAMGESGLIYADGYRKELVKSANVHTETRFLPKNPSLIEPDSYIYYGCYNINTASVLIYERTNGLIVNKYLNSDEPISGADRIYHSWGAHIYYHI